MISLILILIPNARLLCYHYLLKLNYGTPPPPYRTLGMNVARFNFSHGDHATHQMVLERLRKVAEAKSRNIAVLLDTKVCSFLSSKFNAVVRKVFLHTIFVFVFPSKQKN
jgi:pyruvate kinase